MTTPPFFDTANASSGEMAPGASTGVLEAEDGWSALVEALHPREIRRRLGKIGEHGRDEASFDACCSIGLTRRSCPIVEDGSLPMPAPQSDPAPCPGCTSIAIVERQDCLKSESKQLFRQLARLLVAEQIRPADAADKQRVAGEQPRLARPARARGPRRAPACVPACAGTRESTSPSAMRSPSCAS